MKPGTGNTHVSRRLASLALVLLAGGCGPGQGHIGREIEHTLSAPAYTDTARFGSEVHVFYEGRGMQPAWTDGGGLNARGIRVAALLDSASHLGLDPARYGTREISRLREAIDRVDGDEHAAPLIAALDAQITVGYSRYLGDLDTGMLPAGAGAPDRARRERSPMAVRLDEVARGVDPGKVAGGIEPRSAEYRALRSALIRYTDIARNGGWPTVPAGEDDSVSAGALRARLIAESDPREAQLAKAKADPTVLGDSLRAALEHFQARHGLEPTGRLDDETLRELNVPVEDRLETLALNLDRWRALPRDSAELRIRVNIPAYEMAVLEHDRPIMTMKAVVGSVSHQTPVMVDTMESVVINPFWNVPSSIVDDEIAPARAADDHYLRDRNMEVVLRSDPEQTVDEGTIDWDEVEADSVDWFVRQRPGAGNALGDLKFLFPNPLDIYLHDTPTRSTFERATRAVSHGCVRLERPVELARLIFDRRVDAGFDLDRLLAMDEERHVALKSGIPVQLVYMTAWADGESVRFFRDVYGRDTLAAADRHAGMPGTRRRVAAR